MIPRPGETTAIFGGTFDPPHLGHWEAVQGLFSNPGVSRVLVIPSASPPHKPSFAGTEHRLEMARLNFERSDSKGEIVLDFREVERARRNPSMPTYSFDTLQDLKKDFPRLAFVIGADQLQKLSTWHRFPDVLDLCHWIVLARRPDGDIAALSTLSEWEGSGLAQSKGSQQWAIGKKGSTLALVPTEAKAISSTSIRETIGKTGHSPEGALSPEVSAYLKLHRLYGSSPN